MRKKLFLLILLILFPSIATSAFRTTPPSGAVSAQLIGYIDQANIYIWNEGDKIFIHIAPITSSFLVYGFTVIQENKQYSSIRLETEGGDSFWGTLYIPQTFLFTQYSWVTERFNSSQAMTIISAGYSETRINYTPVFINTPPNSPGNPSPANGAKGVSINTTLNWSGGDSDSGDTVTYDVYFGASSSPPNVSSNQSTTSYSLGTLTYSTTYYWKIVSRDNYGAETPGPAWNFTTKSNQPPVLNSIGNKTAAEGQTLSFTISATDPDNDSLTYSASNLPSGASLNTSTQTFSWNPDYTQAGTYTGIHFEVSDGNLTDSEDITITVTNINRAPTANNQSVTTAEDTPVNITLSGSDPDRELLTYTVVTQPAQGSLSGTAPNLTYTPATNFNGSDSFTFKVNDGQTDSAQATAGITVTPINDAPIVNAGNDQVMARGNIATLDGSKSYDPDGDSLSYQWSFISKPEKSNSTLSNSIIQKPTFIPDVDGTYKLKLIVNDGREGSAADTGTITSLGYLSKIIIGTDKTHYKTGEKIDLYLWVGNSEPFNSQLVDAFIGIGLPNGELLFFNSSFNLITSDLSNPKTFTPFVRSLSLPPQFIFPSSNELNYDSDGNGENDTYLLVSFKIPDTLSPGEYYAFAVLAEPGSAQSGNPKIIGNISISEFSIVK